MNLTRRVILSACLAACVVGGTAMAQDKRPLGIYVDKLGTGWVSWSWAKVELSSKNGPDGDGKPIKVDAGPYQALYLHRDELKTKGYTTLGFGLHGGEGGQTLSVIAVIGGKAQSATAVKVIPLAGTWTQVDIPLADLGAANTTIDGLQVLNPTGQAAKTYYINHLGLR